MRRASYFILIVFSVLGHMALSEGPCAAFAERLTLDQIARGHDSESEAAEHLDPLDSALFARQKPAIKSFCSALELDQRREEFLAAVTVVTERAGSCRACRPLGRIFVNSCASAKVSKRFPERSYGKKQRELHPLVIDSAAGFIAPFSKDHEVAVEVARFVRALVVTLHAEETLSPAAKEYFSALTNLMERPFRRYLSRQPLGQVVATHATPDLDAGKRKELLDELF